VELLEYSAIHSEHWEAIDDARRRTGGWWKNVKTLRIRFSDDVLSDVDFTVLEVGVGGGEVVQLRIIQNGRYSYKVKDGPFLLWGFDTFLQWFLQSSPQEQHPRGLKEVWIRNKWSEGQAALVALNEAFVEAT
jgi:hypothetical protein